MNTGLYSKLLLILYQSVFEEDLSRDRSATAQPPSAESAGSLIHILTLAGRRHLSKLVSIADEEYGFLTLVFQ